MREKIGSINKIKWLAHLVHKAAQSKTRDLAATEHATRPQNQPNPTLHTTPQLHNSAQFCTSHDPICLKQETMRAATDAQDCTTRDRRAHLGLQRIAGTNSSFTSSGTLGTKNPTRARASAPNPSRINIFQASLFCEIIFFSSQPATSEIERNRGLGQADDPFRTIPSMFSRTASPDNRPRFGP